MTKHQPRWLTTTVLIVLVAVTAGYGANQHSAGAAPSNLPHGASSVTCQASYVTQRCAVIIQPGTVADTETLLGRYPGTTTGIIAGIAGAACAPAGAAAFVCGLVAAWRAEVFLNALHAAAVEERCVRISWSEMWGIGLPFALDVVPYGQPATWVFVYSPQLEDWTRVWTYPTACRVGSSLPEGIV